MKTHLAPKARIESPKGETMLMEANHEHSTIFVPRLHKWNDILSSSDWHFDAITLPSSSHFERHQIESVVQFPDGSIDLKFLDNPRMSSLRRSASSRLSTSCPSRAAPRRASTSKAPEDIRDEDEDISVDNSKGKVSGVDFTGNVPKVFYQEFSGSPSASEMEIPDNKLAWLGMLKAKHSFEPDQKVLKKQWDHPDCQIKRKCDEKYLQFQVDDLPYSCSYKSINLKNVVPELWKRRDVADRDLIAILRAGAGLPVDDEIFSISPFSEDENSAPLVKNQHKLSLKFSLNGLVDKSPQKSKEYGKDSGKEKGLAGQNEGHPDAPSGGYIAGDVKNDELQAYGELNSFSSPVGSLTEGICSFNEAGVKNHKFIDEITGNMGRRTVQRNDSKPQYLDGDDVGIQTSMPKISKGPNVLCVSGNEDRVQLRENENSKRNDTAAKLGGGTGIEGLS